MKSRDESSWKKSENPRRPKNREIPWKPVKTMKNCGKSVKKKQLKYHEKPLKKTFSKCFWHKKHNTFPGTSSSSGRRIPRTWGESRFRLASRTSGQRVGCPAWRGSRSLGTVGTGQKTSGGREERKHWSFVWTSSYVQQCGQRKTKGKFLDFFFGVGAMVFYIALIGFSWLFWSGLGAVDLRIPWLFFGV